jgi:hypothetical protein
MVASVGEFQTTRAELVDGSSEATHVRGRIASLQASTIAAASAGDGATGETATAMTAGRRGILPQYPSRLRPSTEDERAASSADCGREEGLRLASGK